MGHAYKMHGLKKHDEQAFLRFWLMVKTCLKCMNSIWEQTYQLLYVGFKHHRSYLYGWISKIYILSCSFHLIASELKSYQ